MEENSLEKAVYVYEKYGVNCFAEDTGLEVQALNNEPGANSAHYSGSRNSDENIQFLLLNMKGIQDRRASFKTVCTLVVNSKIDQFTGLVTGTLVEKASGSDGFGYDPIFAPDGSNITFAEMSNLEKSAVSHRSKAFELLKRHLVKISFVK